MNNVKTHKPLRVTFFLNGDLCGELHDKEFDSEEEFNGWYRDMKNSIEIFDSEFVSQ